MLVAGQGVKFRPTTPRCWTAPCSGSGREQNDQFLAGARDAGGNWPITALSLALCCAEGIVLPPLPPNSSESERGSPPNLLNGGGGAFQVNANFFSKGFPETSP